MMTIFLQYIPNISTHFVLALYNFDGHDSFFYLV